jgi:hypothetical protein
MARPFARPQGAEILRHDNHGLRKDAAWDGGPEPSHSSDVECHICEGANQSVLDQSLGMVRLMSQCSNI